MADAVVCRFDDAEVQAFLSQLGESAQEELRPAAQAGADVLYREVLHRVPVSAKGHWFHGTNKRYWLPAGTLRDSIYQVFSKDNSGPQRVTYHVAWNHRKAPHGFMVEFGTSKAAAHPFLRPAYDAMAKTSLDVAYDVYFNRLQARVQGLTQ